MSELVLIRGGGDLASGVALRLHRAGFGVIITELPQPLAVRRTVSFAEAVYAEAIEVEKLRGRRVDELWEIPGILAKAEIPVLISSDLPLEQDFARIGLNIRILIDARLTKHPPDGSTARWMAIPGSRLKETMPISPLVIGLGPGFTAGLDCNAVVETVRGHTMGRVYWQGSAMADTNLPEGDPRRVLRAPVAGRFFPHAEIAQHVEAGQVLAEIRTPDDGRHLVTSALAGVLRGIMHADLDVSAGLKVGDVDPRNDPALCYLVSDKSLAVGGGVLEAILGFRASASRVGS